ncbi:hypothetical protein HPT29_018730 [Microvirga terrae]|uniref:Uncharacterized protein n=1 Tax=Microvirga terrae TaxID=2740529 RepID=A0ABY5RMP3_9HYPH|nr:hypothetical protein [Microvirga terrae]UVF18505.1 hypothetical protein HPT29_018730 [Microvirga terrae]
MRDHDWHKGWDRPNDSRFERHSDCPHHHTSYQDDEPYVRPNWGQSDIREERDWDNLPERSWRNDVGDRSLDPGDTHDGSSQPHDSGFLGWDASAWEDAGGFEAVLSGQLSNSLGHSGGLPPIIVFAIDDLDVNIGTLNQITQVQNTFVFLNASHGGSIDVGGDVTANGLQSAGIMNLQEFS